MTNVADNGNRDRVVDFYSGFGEKEWGRLDREPLEFAVNLHYMKRHLAQKSRLLDIGAGPGKYAMKLAEWGHSLTLADLTPLMVELATAKAAELGLEERFDGGFHVCDACDLSAFADESFDAALMLGPLYHLQDASKRQAAARELHRVVKPGGLVFVAFRSRVNQLVNALLQPEQWKPLNGMDALETFMADGRFDHADPGRYTGAYFYDLAEIEPFMAEQGFESVKLIGSTNVGAMLRPENWTYWANKGEDERARLFERLIRLAEDPSVLGISSHLLYIGRRR